MVVFASILTSCFVVQLAEDGNYSVKALNFLHSQIVERECIVEIKHFNAVNRRFLVGSAGDVCHRVRLGSNFSQWTLSVNCLQQTLVILSTTLYVIDASCS